MGVHWVLKWIELERKWKFLKHLGSEGSWHKESRTLMCQGGLCWPKPRSAWPSLWSALKKSAIGCGSVMTYHVTPLFSGLLSQERNTSRVLGTAMRQVEGCIFLMTS